MWVIAASRGVLARVVGAGLVEQWIQVEQLAWRGWNKLKESSQAGQEEEMVAGAVLGAGDIRSARRFQRVRHGRARAPRHTLRWC